MREREVLSLKTTIETPEPAPVLLVVSTKFDPHADIIIHQLHERQIPFVRFNTEDFPLQSSLTILFDGATHSEELTFPNNCQIKGSDITAVWYRRPAPFEFPSEFSPAAHIFAEKETRATIRGLWQLLDCIWVNHPEKNRVAELKLNQLKTAVQTGFEIPRTLVTNNPEHAREFFNSCSENVIIKCLGGGLVTHNLESTAVYTNIVGQKDSILQMSKTFTASDRYLKYIMSRDKKRMFWLFIGSMSVCLVVIAALVLIIIAMFR